MEKFSNNISFFVKIINKISDVVFGLIKPKSVDEDSERREFILNILLTGSITISFVALTITFCEKLIVANYRGASPSISLAIFLFFVGLYYLSRNGYFLISSYLLIGIFFLSSLYTSYYWGVDIPTSLLLYALIIIMSGILVNTRFAFVISAIIILSILFIGLLQVYSVITPDLFWRKETTTVVNILMFNTILGVIMVVSWLSNREIEKSLRRAHRSEADLKIERDSLEIEVEERTSELKKTQEEKALQMYRFAEFGRMASGLFHDLVNPLTAILLNMEMAKNHGDFKANEMNFDKVAENIENMKQFVNAARKQIQNQEIKIVFSLADEISLAIRMLSYRARESTVQLIFNPPNDLIQTYGNPIKFYRMICDLISNAIDSYDNIKIDYKKKKIIVSLSQTEDKIKISVKDSGCGIKEENLDKIFKPLFTTKNPEKGTGLGLSICKNVVERDFNGEIRVYSKEKKGSVFTALIPIKKQE